MMGPLSVIRERNQRQDEEEEKGRKRLERKKGSQQNRANEKNMLKNLGLEASETM